MNIRRCLGIIWKLILIERSHYGLFKLLIYTRYPFVRSNVCNFSKCISYASPSHHWMELGFRIVLYIFVQIEIVLKAKLELNTLCVLILWGKLNEEIVQYFPLYKLHLHALSLLYFQIAVKFYLYC